MGPPIDRGPNCESVVDIEGVLAPERARKRRHAGLAGSVVGGAASGGGSGRACRERQWSRADGNGDRLRNRPTCET